MSAEIDSIITGLHAGIVTLEHTNEAWVGTAPDQPHLCCSPADLRALLAELDRLRSENDRLAGLESESDEASDIVAEMNAEIVRLREVERRAKDDILAVYDECESVAVPAVTEFGHQATYQQTEAYRATIRKLKARALSNRTQEDRAE